MKKNTECICDDNGIELLVSYEYEETESQVEECHGLHDVGCMVYTQLKSVELVIGGRGVELINILEERQKEKIISKLNYE